MAKEKKEANTQSGIDSASKIEVIKNLIFGDNIAEYNSEFEALKKDIDYKRKELKKYWSSVVFFTELKLKKSKREFD